MNTAKDARERLEKNIALEDEIKQLRDALEFYADEWHLTKECSYCPTSNLWEDHGEKARQALEVKG